MNGMSDLRIKDMPETQRPRERFASLGAGALSDAELLGILFAKGTVGASAVDLGHQLLSEFGSLRNVARCNTKQLEKISGIGPAKAIQLGAAIELGNRLAREKVTNTRLDSPEAVYDLVGHSMSKLTYESLRVVLLNTRHHLIRSEEVSHGSLNESIAQPREILQPAILHSAYGFVLVHNHPSGDPSPSGPDRDLTRRLASICGEIKIELIDHLIVGLPDGGQEPYFSFKEAGLL